MRAVLESLLRARKLDVTLAAFGPAGEPFGPPIDESRLAPTGAASLDSALGGGLRRGHLSEIVGAPSSGRTRVVIQALAAASARGEAVALVDTSDAFDPASAAAHGVALPQLLWVREAGPSTQLGAGPSTRLGAGDLSRALKACSLILQAGGFGLVVFDLADVAAPRLRQCPATTWMRLARMVEGSDTVALLVAAEHVARSAGGATVACQAATLAWQGTTARARVFAGLETRPRVVGARP